MRLMTLTITTITTNKMKMVEVDKEEIVEKRKKKKHLMSTYFSPGTSLSALYLIFTITE